MNDAQEWFNKEYSQKKKSINELKISNKDLDSPLKIDGFTKLETIYLKNLKLTNLEISNCSQLTKISLSELTLLKSTSNLEISSCSELNEVKLSKCRIKSLFVSNCPKLTTLDCPPCELTEISHLDEVKHLKCQIKSLSVIDCPKLTTPSCELTSLVLSNQLAELDISNISTSNLEISRCSELNNVKFSKCRIKSLFVGDCPKLKKLDCPSCELTELDISNLIKLNCSRNKIKYLNLNLCPKITTLNCSYNELNTLEISNCSELEVLNCHDNQLAGLDISNCPGLKNPERSEKFITTSNPADLVINKEREAARNLLIVGRTGSGKSALSNLLSGTTEFEENDGSISVTKNFQKKVFEDEDRGMKYRVVDTIGVGDTNLDKKKVLYKIAEGIYSIPEGISQVLFVVDGKFTEEEIQAFELFAKVIFQNDILEYITIVRTKFSNFKNKGECNEDKKQLLKENEQIAEIVKLCKIVHVDNPPINLIINDDEDEETVEINKNIRKKARELLLKYLETVQEKKEKERKDEYFKLKAWDQLHNDLITNEKGEAAQELFNKNYSQKIIITNLEIDKDFDDNPLIIDGFTKLKTIDLKNLKLTSLEISNCSQLAKIDLSDLTSNLKISCCSELNEVKISKCRIKSLSVSDCPTLKKLDCPSCELTDLNISNLIKLNCSRNKIKYLNLNPCPEITRLNCSNNELNTLEISNCSKLEVLNCHNNRLTNLDISNCPKLKNYPEKSDKFITTSNPADLVISKGEAVENLSIVGSTGDGDKENNRAQKWLNRNKISYHQRKDQEWFNRKYSQKKKSINGLEISNKVFDRSLKIVGFTKLEIIDLKSVKLTSLRISNCSQLIKINLSEFNLSTNLEISNCSELIEIKLSECQIKRLFVSECPKITKLDCPSCELTELDISNLIELNCSSNQIKYLNLNLCPKITALNCSNNQLNTLEISNCSNLEVLNCHKNQLTSLDISNCPKLKNPEKSENFITTSNPNLIISENGKAASNLLIVGRTGGGKSTLSNVLSNSDEFKESSYSIRETKNFRRAVFQWNGTNYRVVDTIGVGDTNLDKKKVLYKIAEGIYSMPEGISQVLFVVNGRFTEKEIQAFELFAKVIFQNDILEYITLVRTKFSNFNNEGECDEDKNQLLKENEKIAEIVESCNGIVYVDNPSTNIARDDDYQIRMELNIKRREKSRVILLEHLENQVNNKENYKFKTWDELRDVIANYVESDEIDMEEMEITNRSYLPSFLKKLLKN